MKNMLRNLALLAILSTLALSAQGPPSNTCANVSQIGNTTTSLNSDGTTSSTWTCSAVESPVAYSWIGSQLPSGNIVNGASVPPARQNTVTTVIPATTELLVGSGTLNLAADSQTQVSYNSTYSNLLFGPTVNTTVTGVGNTAFGVSTGASLTAPVGAPSGILFQGNTLVGFQAGKSAKTAREITAVGYHAGYSLIGNGDGLEDCIDTMFGSQAGFSELCTTANSGSGYNVFVGQKAGLNSTNSLNMIMLGTHAGTDCYTGCYGSTIIGHTAANGATSSSTASTVLSSIVIGEQAYGNTTGGILSNSILLGANVAPALTTAQGDIFIGVGSGNAEVTGSNNVFVGGSAGHNSTASSNTMVGPDAGVSATTATDITVVGNAAGAGLTTGTDDTAVGNNAGGSLRTASDASIFGSGAASSASVPIDAFGYLAGRSVSTGIGNSVFGNQALRVVTTGANDSAFGYHAFQSLTGSWNSAFGYEAGYGTTSGGSNTFVGSQAGYLVTTGSNNVIVGADHAPANPLTTGSNNEMIGFNAYVCAACTGSVQMGLGSNLTSNTMQFQGFNYLNSAGAATLLSVTPSTLYSAAGTALPACSVGIKGQMAVVSDATSPTYMGAYSSRGLITTAVICSYNGSTYSWLTH